MCGYRCVWSPVCENGQGEKAGVYNVTGLRQAIAEYDRLWGEYRLLPGKLPGYVVNGSMMSDRFWVHPSTGQPGMGQSVDKFRGV